jgi:hypothetical protein
MRPSPSVQNEQGNMRFASDVKAALLKTRKE